MKELVEKVKACLADSFTFALKSQSYHWNVIGSDFPQLHDFFGVTLNPICVKAPNFGIS